MCTTTMPLTNAATLPARQYYRAAWAHGTERAAASAARGALAQTRLAYGG